LPRVIKLPAERADFSFGLRVMRLAFVLLASLWLGPSGAAGAAPGQGEEVVERDPLPQAGRFRLDLRAGLGVRRDTLDTAGAHIGASGAAVSDVVLGGAWFAASMPLGVAGRFELDRFALRERDAGGAASATGFEAALAVAGRLQPGDGPVLIEGQAGYGLLQAPVARLPAASGELSSSDAVAAHGPVLGLVLATAPADWFTLEASGRAWPVTFGGRYQETPIGLRRLAAGLGATVGRVAVGDFRVSALFSYELASTSADADGVAMKQLRHQLAIGLRATPPPPARAAVVIAPPVVPASPPRGRITGVVRLEGGKQPLAGVTVSVADGGSARTGADGRFVLGDLPPGLLKVNLARADLVPGTEVVSVPPGAEVSVEVTLRRAEVPAPAVVIGLVRGEDGAPVAARVRLIEPNLAADADARGRFRFEVPAGRYTLTIEAPGFISQKKAVRAGAGEQNIYNVDLQVER
jgi:hypothetical protein